MMSLLRFTYKNVVSCCSVFLCVVAMSFSTIAIATVMEKEPSLVNWVFSGVVSNEKGEQYGYFFQMIREGSFFHSIATLYDAQTKAVIFQDESQENLNEPIPYRWHVGHAFLRFDPINDSWIFGVKTKDKKGFNFKIDMLSEADHHPVEEGLRPGLGVIISQSRSLNGHILINEHYEQFVTAKHAWFRQIAMTSADEAAHSITGVLCHFDDNSGFYSIQLPESDALRGAIAGRFDIKGLPAKMSQFVSINKLSEGAWDIQVPSPNLHIVLSDYIKQNAVTAGFVTNESISGFCMLSDERFGKV